MLTGNGAYAEIQAQTEYPEIAYQQISQCALKAWKQLPSSEVRTEELSKIQQGPDEPYQDFVDWLLKSDGQNCG